MIRGVYMKKRVGVIGCGNISDIYIQNIINKFDNLELVAISNRTMEKAKQKAIQYSIKKVETIDEIMTDPEVDIILILTTPESHSKLVRDALNNKKHVYVEKPFTLNLEEAKELDKLAKLNNLLLGVAPDTILGGSIQECKKIIYNGEIGKIIAIDAFFTCRGHERWHPNPGFYYQFGGGPILDLGPYYLSAIVNLAGPISGVTALSSTPFKTRVVEKGPKKGEIINVNVPTTYSGVMRMKNGALATIMMSFDIWKSNLPRIEIHGTKGSLLVPDPNKFGDPIKISREGQEYENVDISDTRYLDNSRGLGLSDLANCIESNEEPKASSSVAIHVLEAMFAFEESNKKRREIQINTSFDL
jgi:predicted dehydrogenase